jgi:hypothetical protein
MRIHSMGKRWGSHQVVPALPAVRWLPLGPLGAGRARYGDVMVCAGVTV